MKTAQMLGATIAAAALVPGIETTAQTIELSRNGAAEYVIAYDEGTAIPSEKTAVRELADYLQRITGAEFKVVATATDRGPKKLVVGPNQLSRKALGEKTIAELGGEEFIVRTMPNGDIYLVGGRPRGTMYAVYHFLDNILGVRWYSPEFEYVPKEENLTIGQLDVREKPSFEIRYPSGFFGLSKDVRGIVDPTWAARNRLNDNGSVYGREVTEMRDEYGWGVFSASPECHGLYMYIPPQEYFPKHPEWWALYKGKRTVYGSAHGGEASYCLSNAGLAKEAARRVVKQLRKYPQASRTSIAEGDSTAGPCECEPCKELQEKLGGVESGPWVFFANRVAQEVKKESPDLKLTILAYTRTAAPPKSIEVDDSIAVRLCAWSRDRGLPYYDPKNESGRDFIENYFLPWRKICKNLYIWDYIVAYPNFYEPQPDLLVIIDNMRFFKQHGVPFVYSQGTNRHCGGNGQPFKTWLVARCQWNPDHLDGKAILKRYCDEYFGEAAGRYVYEYYVLLRNVCEKAGYIAISQSGSAGNPPHQSLETLIKARELLQEALAASKGNPIHHKHVRIAYAPVQYILVRNYNELRADATRRNLKMPEDFRSLYESLHQTATEFGLIHDISQKRLDDVVETYEKLGDMDFTATASSTYACSVYQAFDGALITRADFGAFSGWILMEFDAPREIERINMFLGIFSSTEYEYSVGGSLDGRNYFDLAPKRIVRRGHDDPTYQRAPVATDDRVNPPSKVKYVRIEVHRALCREGKPSWAGVAEVLFNATDAEVEKASKAM